MIFYELLFSQSHIILALSFLFALIAKGFIGARISTLQIVMFSLTSVMSPAFFSVAILHVQSSFFWDTIFSVIFEFFILLSSIYFLSRGIRSLSETSVEPLTNLVVPTILASWVFVFLLASLGGFGVFSTDSRIDYLTKARWAKYVTYGVTMIGVVQALLVARFIQEGKKVKHLILALVISNFLLSLVSGSKGGAFLWILSCFALLPRIYFKVHSFHKIARLFSLCLVGAVTLVIYLNMRSVAYDQPVVTLMQEGIARISLNNDARALALDLRERRDVNHDRSLFLELFPFVKRIIGEEPSARSFGSTLYSDGLRIGGNRGANASFVSLVTYFTLPGDAWPVLFFSLFIFLLIWMLFGYLRKTLFQAAWAKALFSVFVVSFIQILSQDFLSAQVLAVNFLLFASVLCCYKLLVSVIKYGREFGKAY